MLAAVAGHLTPLAVLVALEVAALVALSMA
jgi:hypothetical protein